MPDAKPRAQVADVMTRQAHIIDTESSVLRAAVLMREFNCGSLPVARDGKLVGIVTDRDIVIRAVAAGMNPDSVKVKGVMTVGALTCYADEPLELAADIMSDNDVRRLVVLGDGDEVIGVLSDSDVIKCPDSDLINDSVLHHLYKYA